MAVQTLRRYTPAEYLSLERAAENRSEFYKGDIVAMSGASRAHNRIGVNVSRLLDEATEETRCEVYANDMRVQIEAEGFYTYPDIVVVCEEPQFADGYLDTLLNPSVLVEILSDSTERYDRGRKFERYRRLLSLREYVLIAQDRPQIERFSRESEGEWRYQIAEGVESSLHVPSLGCVLPLHRVYAKVLFNEVGRE